MKDYYGFILLLVGIIVCALIFSGVVTSIRKSFRENPETNTPELSPLSAESEQLRAKQKKHAEKIKEEQERFRREQMQRMRDSRRL